MRKYRNIYMLAPYNSTTGGIELGHQLIDYLRNKNENAFIVYIECDKIHKNDHIVTPAYAQYNIQITDIIEDHEDNILILPEVFFDWILKFKHIQIGCWWMSVDNRYINCSLHDVINFKKTISDKWNAIHDYRSHKKYHNKNSNRLLKKEETRITHFYQSHYAQFHLYQLGFSKVLPLSDYINIDFIKENMNLDYKNKKDIILYNPQKGLHFTQQIITKMPDCKFIPLKGLSRVLLKQLFSEAKLYIDFGHFPGKDRLHREAAINKCCIITGKNGASFFYEDVPIENKYKFETKKSALPAIEKQIRYVLTHYNTCIDDFEYLRKTIMKEQTIFYSEIENAFL